MPKSIVNSVQVNHGVNFMVFAFNIISHGLEEALVKWEVQDFFFPFLPLMCYIPIFLCIDSFDLYSPYQPLSLTVGRHFTLYFSLIRLQSIALLIYLMLYIFECRWRCRLCHFFIMEIIDERVMWNSNRQWICYDVDEFSEK